MDRLYRLKSKWSTYHYNFAWTDWVLYIDGWIPKFAFFVPILGYLVLFNDEVSNLLIFSNLTNANVNLDHHTMLDGEVRLRLVYFGLIFLGVSNFVYKFRRPHLFRFGTTQADFTRTALELFTLSDYIDINGIIRGQGHLTRSGKYYSSEWDGFREAATNTDEGTDNVKRDGNWDEARSQYGNLLRDMLREHYFRITTQRRFSLALCIILSTIGYFCLVVPSLDIFIEVLKITIFSG